MSRTLIAVWRRRSQDWRWSKAFDTLDAPVKRVTSPHTPVPATPCLEAEYVPSVERVMAAVEETLSY